MAAEEFTARYPYFPGSIDRRSAVRVQVDPGADVNGIDIRLARAAMCCAVRGRVTGITRVSTSLMSRHVQEPAGSNFLQL